MRYVPVNSIREGSFLAKTIYDINGTVLLAKGIRLNDKLLRSIELNGIYTLYINDEYSDNEIEDIIKPELRQKAAKTLKDSFSSMAKYEDTLNAGIKSYNRKQAVDSKYRYTDELYKVVDCIVDEVLSKKDIVINLVDIKSMDDYTYQHSVNVIVLSLILGIELNYDRERLSDLAVGAMLHDIGKVFVPMEVLKKRGKLTTEEYSMIREHTTKGYEYLANNSLISSTSRIVALQHHEKVDGTGYPNRLKGDKIYDYSKIVAIADVYDALTSDRPYRGALPPNEALEYIMGGVDRNFDYKLVKAFIKRVVPYPIGTVVKLSNGDVGVIEELNPGFPLYPRIRVVKFGLKSRRRTNIDLMKEKDIVISGIQYVVPE